MVNFEAAKRLAPNLLDSSKRWLLDTIQNHQNHYQRFQQRRATTNEGDGEEAYEQERDKVSTEYLVHNWLEALFAWFQIIILWHEPRVSLGAISGLLISFLLLVYFAPRFYATILIAIFVYNLNKFWFRHVWPDIRVPPGEDREEEMRLDVDRWTYLHPQLMTLVELKQHVEKFKRLGGKYLQDLLLLRQQKPVTFCSLLCSIFMCTAIIGSRLSGMCLVFCSVAILMTAPGIYVHLLPDNLKELLWQNIGLKLLAKIKSVPEYGPEEEHYNQGEASVAQSTGPGPGPPSTSSTASSVTKESIAASLSSTTRSIEQLFEHFKRKSFPSLQSAASKPSIEEEDEAEEECDERTKLIDIPLDTSGERRRPLASVGEDDTNSRSQDGESSRRSKNRRRSSDLSSNDESLSLIESDDDQHDGFVML